MERNFKQIKKFAFRWKEPLGDKLNPYAHRHLLVFGGFSIRIHRWYCTDAVFDKNKNTHFHNHPWWFFTFIIKGSYKDITPTGTQELKRFSFKFRKANHLHYVKPGKNGCISILFTGRPKSKWGFLVNDRILRPIKYFRKFGKNAPCKN